jgi:hypothetical protein
MWKKCLVGGLFVLACVASAVLSHGLSHAWQVKEKRNPDAVPFSDQKIKAEKTTNPHFVPMREEKQATPAPSMLMKAEIRETRAHLTREEKGPPPLPPPQKADKLSPAAFFSSPPATPTPPPPTPPTAQMSSGSAYFLDVASPARTPQKSSGAGTPPPLPQESHAASNDDTRTKSAPTVPDLLNRLKQINEQRAALDKEEKAVAETIKSQLAEQRKQIDAAEQELQKIAPRLSDKKDTTSSVPYPTSVPDPAGPFAGGVPKIKDRK